MSDTNFQQGTVVRSTWLNAINDFFYTLFQGATTAAAARTALGLSDGSSNLTVNDLTVNGNIVATKFPQWLQFAISDQSNAITTGTAKFTTRLPACTILSIRASLKTASSSGIPTFDINENGVSILSTLLTIDANEKTSTTAATPVVISDTAIADDSEITFDVDVAGTGAVGAVISMLVRWA